MKKLFAALIFLLLLAGRAGAAFYANYFTTNANPVAGGGIVGSTNFTFNIFGVGNDLYTNSTPYGAFVTATAVMSGSNQVSCMVTNPDLTLFKHTPYNFPLNQFSGNAVSNSWQFYVPPYGIYRVFTNGLLSASAVGRERLITYIATNGASGSGGGGSGTTYTNDTGLPGAVNGSSIGTNLASLMIKTNPVGYFGSTYELSTNRIPYWQGASYVNSSYTFFDSWNNGILTVFAKINGAGGYDYYWGSLTNQAQVFQVSDTPRDGNEPRVGFNYNYDSGDFEGDLHYQWVWRTNSGLYYIGELSTFFNYIRYRASDGDFSFGVSNQSLTLTATNVIGTNYTGYGTTTLADLNVTGTMTGGVVRAVSYVASGTYIGNAAMLTNVPGTSITGALTNNTTGSAATVTSVAGNATQIAAMAQTNWPAWSTNKSDYYRGVMGGADDWIVSIDLGVDLGDATTQCLLNYFQDNGEANIIAYLTPMTNTFAAACIEVLNRAYGRGHIPIGMNKATSAYVNTDYFGNYLATNYYNSIGDRANALSDVTLARRVLATRADHSLSFLVIGQWTNVKRLYDSAADAISPLTGAELIALKIRRFVVMGGDYPSGSEYNFTTDPASAAIANTITNYKSFIGYTAPLNALIGLTISNLTSQHPLRGAYTNYQYTTGGTSSRPAWDETAAWYGVRGDTWKGVTYFTRHSTGYNTINASTGANTWTDDGIDHNQEYITFAVSLNTFTNEVNTAITTEPLNGNAAALSIKGGEIKSLNLTGTGIFGMTNYVGYLYASNGSAALPSITFASAPNYGFYPVSGVAMGVVANGVEQMRFYQQYLDMKSDESIRWSSSTLGNTADLMLDRASAGLLRVTDGVSTSSYRDVRLRTLTATNFVVVSAASVTVTVTSGSGSPESAVTAPVGSLYLRTDGGYTTTFYVKTNGSGNTGWGAK